MTEHKDRLHRQTVIASVTQQANDPKHRLMGLATALTAEGCHRKAKVLNSIIAHLELWQTSP
jgi:hypothetical protein